MSRKQNPISRALEHFSSKVSHWAGSSTAFAIAVSFIVGWAIAGPIFGFSNRWQLVVNTGTTIVTFLMVFLIQRAQNKDAMAIQLKLNELVKAVKGASNRLIDIEDLDEAELETLHRYYAKLAEIAKHKEHVGKSHSIEEAEAHAKAKSATG